jgi:acylaminoacyl-peptidase
MVDYIDGTSVVIGLFGVAKGNLESLIAGKDGVNLYMTVSRTGVVAWQQSGPRRHGTLLVSGGVGQETQQVVELNPQVRSWNLGIQEVIRWRNSHGDEREGVLILPVGYRVGTVYPAIVDAYPQQMDGFKGSEMAGNQAWASRGYVVFFPNPRPPHFARALSRKRDRLLATGPNGWATAIDDVVSGVDAVVAKGIVDRNRVGLYGFSNGGGVVNYVAAQTDRFRCAVSVSAVLPDWLTSALIDTDSGVLALAGGVTPWDDPSAYIQLSAVYQARGIQIPYLLAVGDEDQHGFTLGAIEMYNALRHFGADVTFLRYRRQGHGFSGAAMADFWDREDAFWDAHLVPQGGATAVTAGAK